MPVEISGLASATRREVLRAQALELEGTWDPVFLRHPEPALATPKVPHPDLQYQRRGNHHSSSDQRTPLEQRQIPHVHQHPLPLVELQQRGFQGLAGLHLADFDSGVLDGLQHLTVLPEREVQADVRQGEDFLVPLPRLQRRHPQLGEVYEIPLPLAGEQTDVLLGARLDEGDAALQADVGGDPAGEAGGRGEAVAGLHSCHADLPWSHPRQDHLSDTAREEAVLAQADQLGVGLGHGGVLLLAQLPDLVRYQHQPARLGQHKSLPLLLHHPGHPAVRRHSVYRLAGHQGHLQLLRCANGDPLRGEPNHRRLPDLHGGDRNIQPPGYLTLSDHALRRGLGACALLALQRHGVTITRPPGVRPRSYNRLLNSRRQSASS
mmetsp:Transcript_85421/g.228419  ORF Transcript_85421/g.228419 Transcript_85421/m.228419 type:complete len:378 (-) Transcript_85421:36-1169(-)